MSASKNSRARFGSAPTQKENNHKHNRGNATDNADPYAPVPVEKFAEAFTPGAIRIALDRLVGHANLCQDDLPDLVQELLGAAWEARNGYKPDYVSPKTGKRVRFVSYIGEAMNKRASMILRTRSQKHRNPEHGIVSLDDPGRDPEHPRDYDAEAAFADWMSNGASPEFSAMFDRVDLEFALETLPLNLRLEARMLFVERQPVAAVAVAVGLKPTTIYHKHIPQIEALVARAMGEG